MCKNVNVNVNVYVYAYANAYVYAYAYVYVDAYAYVYVDAYAYAYANAYACANAYVYVYVNVYVYAYGHVYVYVNVNVYVYVYVYAYVSVYLHSLSTHHPDPLPRLTSKPKPWFDTSETECEAEAVWSQPYRRGTASPTQGEEGEDASDAKETQVWGVSGVSPKMPWKWRRYCGWLRNLTPVGNYERYLWNTVNNGIRMGKKPSTNWCRTSFIDLPSWKHLETLETASFWGLLVESIIGNHWKSFWMKSWPPPK